jgi:hypothetical protein
VRLNQSHPSQVTLSWYGDSVGHYEGDMLVVDTVGGLKLQFTVEDNGVFTMPWSATMTYRRALGQWPEFVCAENIREHYNNKHSDVTRADKPDF